MAAPKFSVGQKVNHPASKPGASPEFEAGTGTIASVNPDGSYKVTSDDTGTVLGADFKEAELSAA